MVREISTVALSTEAAIKLAQSWGLFWRSSRRGVVEAVMRAFWADLEGVEYWRDCDCDMGEDCIEAAQAQ